MRGDSLRDLYAKALALLGLGLLAATGALVDYWPVQTDMPGISSALVLPAGVALPSIADPSAQPPPGPTGSRRTQVSLRELTRVSPAAIMADASDMTTFGLLDPNAPSSVAMSDVPPSLAVAPAATGSMPVSTLDLLPPVISAAELPDLSPSPVPTSQNGGNMFTGAAKSVGRAGQKTGSAVWDGFVSVASVVGHVFRW